MLASLHISIPAAMLKKPVVTEVRTPTNTWSGLGFSKSMPAETIKELRRANHVSYKPSMSTTYEVHTQLPRGTTQLCSHPLWWLYLGIAQIMCLSSTVLCLTMWITRCIYSMVFIQNNWIIGLPFFSFSQGSPLSLSRSSSREGIGNGSDSDNWRERNGTGNGLPSHTEFPSAVSSPKRKQNKSGQYRGLCYKHFTFFVRYWRDKVLFRLTDHYYTE